MATGGERARLLLAPVHLRALRQTDGAMLFVWVRRGRFASDAWDGEEIPLDASAERYRLKITADGATLAETECATPQWSWPANAVAAAAGANLLRLEVRQTSPELGPGLPATLDFHL